MLTAIQEKPRTHSIIHDLPTPPRFHEPSPPLGCPEHSSSTAATKARQSHNTSNMSAPHRGLPPPAAMTLPPQQAPSAPVAPPQQQQQQQPPHPPPHHQHPPQQQQQQHMGPPSGHHHHDSWSSSTAPLPPPPQHWQSSDDSMRNWLQAKAEEEKTKQEEERTRQEKLRLEQRKVEMDILRASLTGGIPPPMVPLVFAGMGGGNLPQAALEWAQKLMPAPSHQAQLMPPQRQGSVEPQRDATVQPPPQGGQYPTVGPAQGSAAPYVPYGESPTRARGQTVSGIPGQGPAGNPQQANYGGAASGAAPPYQTHRSTASYSSQLDSNPSIYFHHWQPPATQAGGSSNRPATPSAESQRKRKAVGGEPQQPSRASSVHRSRSPPSFIHVDAHSQAGAGHKSHKRHKSDVSWFQGPRHRPGTPLHDNSSVSSRDRDTAEDRKPPVSYHFARERDRSNRLSQEPYGPPGTSASRRNVDEPYQHHSKPPSPANRIRKAEALDG